MFADRFTGALKKIIDVLERFVRRAWMYLLLILVLVLNIPVLFYDHSQELLRSAFGWELILPLSSGLLLILFIRKAACSFEWKAVTAALVIGLIFALLQPANNGYDEEHHFFKTVATLDGKTIGYDTYNYEISESFYTVVDNRGALPDDEVFREDWSQDTRMTYALHDGAAMPTYPSWGYVFSCAGVGLARALGGNVITVYLAGRIANLIGFLLLAFLALRITPAYKKIFALFLLMPVTLYVASSYSQDTVTYGLIMLIFAVFLKWRVERRVTWPWFLLFAVCMLLLTPLKFPYLLLLGLLFMVPGSSFTFRHANLWKIVCIAAVVILAFLWMRNVSSEFTEFRVEGFDRDAQIAFVLSHPFKVLLIFLGSFFTQFADFVSGLFNVSYAGYIVPGAAQWCYLFFLLYCLIRERDLSFSKYERVWLFLIGLCIWQATNLALYVTFTPVGDLYTLGVQARYLTPLILIIAMLFSRKRKNAPAGREQTVLAVSVTFSSLLLMTMLVHFYLF